MQYQAVRVGWLLGKILLQVAVLEIEGREGVVQVYFLLRTLWGDQPNA